MSALEVRPLRGQARGSKCEGGCATGSKNQIAKPAARQLWVMGREAGRWCVACTKRWQQLFDEAEIRLASQLEGPLGDAAEAAPQDSLKVAA